MRRSCGACAEIQMRALRRLTRTPAAGLTTESRPRSSFICMHTHTYLYARSGRSRASHWEWEAPFHTTAQPLPHPNPRPHPRPPSPQPPPHLTPPRSTFASCVRSACGSTRHRTCRRPPRLPSGPRGCSRLPSRRRRGAAAGRGARREVAARPLPRCWTTAVATAMSSRRWAGRWAYLRRC